MRVPRCVYGRAPRVPVAKRYEHSRINDHGLFDRRDHPARARVGVTRMSAEVRAERRGFYSRIRVLVISANLQPRNLFRVQLHRKAIEVLLHGIQDSKIS